MSDERREFEAFLREDRTPPRQLSERILAFVHRDLVPVPSVVALKLLALQAVAAAIVVAFCPQLGVGPLGGGHGIMHLFMRFGDVACAAMCGSLFLGTSTLLASALLRREELRYAGRHGALGVTLLASASFAGLMLAGGEADRLTYLCWLGGALVGGWGMLRAGVRLRLGRPALVARAAR